MIEPNTEDRLEAERIKTEYMKVQERLAIQALVSATKGVLMAEGAILQTWLANQAFKMQNFSTSQVPASLEGGLTGGAADAIKKILTEVPKPDFSSPIL